MLLGLQESCNKSFEAAANCQPCAYSWLRVCRVASKNWPRTDTWDVGKVDGILDVQIQSIFNLYIWCFLERSLQTSTCSRYCQVMSSSDLPGQEWMFGHPGSFGVCHLGDAHAHHDGTQGQGVPRLRGQVAVAQSMASPHFAMNCWGSIAVVICMATLWCRRWFRHCRPTPWASWSTNWRKGWEEIARDWWDWRGQAERMCSCIFLQGFMSSFQWGECSGGGIAYLCLSRAATSYRMLWGGNNWLGGHFAAARHLVLNAFSKVLLCFLRVMFHCIIYTTNSTAPQTSVSQPALGPIVLKPGGEQLHRLVKDPYSSNVSRQRVEVDIDLIQFLRKWYRFDPKFHPIFVVFQLPFHCLFSFTFCRWFAPWSFAAPHITWKQSLGCRMTRGAYDRMRSIWWYILFWIDLKCI